MPSRSSSFQLEPPHANPTTRPPTPDEHCRPTGLRTRANFRFFASNSICELLRVGPPNRFDGSFNRTRIPAEASQL